MTCTQFYGSMNTRNFFVPTIIKAHLYKNLWNQSAKADFNVKTIFAIYTFIYEAKIPYKGPFIKDVKNPREGFLQNVITLMNII